MQNKTSNEKDRRLFIMHSIIALGLFIVASCMLFSSYVPRGGTSDMIAKYIAVGATFISTSVIVFSIFEGGLQALLTNTVIVIFAFLGLWTVTFLFNEFFHPYGNLTAIDYLIVIFLPPAAIGFGVIKLYKYLMARI